MKLVFQILLLLFFYSSASAQCTVVIPANTVVITNDTVIDCSFIPGSNFLVCTGASLTMTGNSTCINHFYMENASVVTFTDTLPGAPYGIFSFFIRGIAILDFNDDSPVSFGIIDTLVYEPTVLLIDTGSAFHFKQMCPALVFDYSLMPTSSPCVTTQIAGMNVEQNFLFGPVPFSNYLDLEIKGENQSGTIQIFDLPGREVERFEISGTGNHRLGMKNNWSGVAYIQVIQNGKIMDRKIIARNNQE